MRFVLPRNAFRLPVLAVCFFFLAGVAGAGVIQMNVYPSIGPDPFNSLGTFTAYSANALYALQNGLSSYGASGPTYYSRATSFDGAQVLGTDPPLHSWMGQASPSAPYDTQSGNMLMYGLVIQSMGTPFDLNDITFQDTFYGNPGPVESLATVGFGFRLIGFTSASTWCTSASPMCTVTTPLTTAYFSGFGDQFDGGSTVASLNAAIASINADVQAGATPTSTGTYTLAVGGNTYVGAAEIGPVPEPGTIALAGLGLVLAGVIRKRLK
jgi:hypothetical protein